MEEAVGNRSCCSSSHLEVDVNGQETFLVDQKVIALFSGRFARLFGAKSARKTGKMKVILHDFPGGAAGFELIAVFCYNNCNVRITPHNLILLNSAARFMEMDEVTSWFLIHYMKRRLAFARPIEKRAIIESMIEQLSFSDRNSLSWRSLSMVFRLSLGINIGTRLRILLERLMGSKLHEATLDHLLFPPPDGICYAYDVDSVLRMVRAYFDDGSSSSSPRRLNKVGHLLDSYLLEIAPDRNLQPPKFESLATVLPDSARESHDLLYRSTDLYFEVHNHLNEEQKQRIYRAVNYEKLSAEAMKHFSENLNFPANFRAHALRLVTGSPYYSSKDRRDERNAGAHFQRLGWRIVELEKSCKMLHNEMAYLVKHRKMSGRNCESHLPKLCS